MCEKAELEPFFSVDEIADSVGMSPRSVRRWIDEEGLAAHTLGRSVRISESDWKAFLEKKKK